MRDARCGHQRCHALLFSFLFLQSIETFHFVDAAAAAAAATVHCFALDRTRFNTIAPACNRERRCDVYIKLIKSLLLTKSEACTSNGRRRREREKVKVAVSVNEIAFNIRHRSTQMAKRARMHAQTTRSTFSRPLFSVSRGKFED